MTIRRAGTNHATIVRGFIGGRGGGPGSGPRDGRHERGVAGEVFPAARGPEQEEEA